MSEQRQSSIKRFIRAVLLGLVPLVALTVGTFWYALGGRYVTTENAYIKRNMVAVSPAINGRVVEVLVTDNQTVSKGDMLFALDPRIHQIAVVRANAKIKRVGNDIRAMRAQHAQIEAEIADALERVAYLQRQLKRQEELHAKGMATEAIVDGHTYDVSQSIQSVRALEQRARQVIEALGGSRQIPVAEHPMHLEAVAEKEAAELSMEHTIVRAASDGIVSRVQLQPGEWVEEGEPVFQLIEKDDVWVEANLKETQLTHVQVGQSVSFEVDAYPGQTWHGQVKQISPATGSEFMVLPPQNATGNWIKVVQRLPVRITIDSLEGRAKLRTGMTATVSVDTLYERELGTFIRTAMGIDFRSDQSLW